MTPFKPKQKAAPNVRQYLITMRDVKVVSNEGLPTLQWPWLDR
jgi:hypothetical protein